MDWLGAQWIPTELNYWKLKTRFMRHVISLVGDWNLKNTKVIVLNFCSYHFYSQYQGSIHFNCYDASVLVFLGSIMVRAMIYKQ